MNLLNKKNIINIFEWSIALYVAGTMCIYGFSKFIQFNESSPENNPAMRLMWDFYGYSKPFVLIIGFLEVFSSMLMLLPKTRIIGCLFLTTILSNIILQDYFYNVPALSTAIVLQLLVLIILALNGKELILGIKIFALSNKNLVGSYKILQVILIFVLALLMFFTVPKLF